MLELLKSLSDLVQGLAAAAWGVALTVLNFIWDMGVWLHVESPRFEGLLAGILLAWVLLRRDKHPLLRVLSSPLKLVLDILDLAWGQCTEVVNDLWNTTKEWTILAFNWVKDRVVSVYNWKMNLLKSLKDKLASKDEINKQGKKQ